MNRDVIADWLITTAALLGAFVLYFLAFWVVTR